VARRTFIKGFVAVGLSLVSADRGFARVADRRATPTMHGGDAMLQPDSAATGATPAAGTLEMSITRTFDAPVTRVWRAWSDPEDVKRWWGPQGFTAPVADLDFRVGGTSLVAMRSPEGQVLYNTWTYTKIEPMELIEFIQHFADEDGDPIAPEDVGLPRRFRGKCGT